MKQRINETQLEQAITALPYYAPSRAFNGKVLAALGFAAARRPVIVFRDSMLKIAVLTCLSWVMVLTGLCGYLLFQNIFGIFSILMHPHRLISYAGLLALDVVFIGAAILKKALLLVKVIMYLKPDYTVLSGLVAVSIVALIFVAALNQHQRVNIHK